MKSGVLASCLLAAALGVSAQTLDPVPRISAQQLSVADGVLLAGVPNLEKLLQLPVDTTVVVELRTAPEGIAEEARVLREQGYAYHHIPVSGAEIGADQLAALSAIAAANGDKTLIVHCRSANRAAMLWGAHLLEQGWTLEQTLSTVGPALKSKAGKLALLAFSAKQQAESQK